MKRLILFLLLAACVLPLAVTGEGMSLSHYSKEAVLAEIGTVYPGWTVSEAEVYGSGSYNGQIATHVSVLLYRLDQGRLLIKNVSVLANPLWEGKDIEWKSEDRAPVPVTDEAAARIAAMAPNELTEDGSSWLSCQVSAGCADFMLAEGETWTDLGVFADRLIGAVRGPDGRTVLRTVQWDGNSYGEVVTSPMWERSWSLNTIHSGHHSLELGVDEGMLYVDLYPDGQWRLSGVNNGYGIYIFNDGYLLDGTNGGSQTSNDLWHYGTTAFPRTLDRLDIDPIPMRGADLIRLLDAGKWACVRETGVPLYSAPDSKPLAYACARLAGTIVMEKGDWVCLLIGGGERGMQAWFRRDQLAFGAETEQIRCGFPDYRYDRKANSLSSILNEHLNPRYFAYSDDYDDAACVDTLWLIARRPEGGFLAEVNGDAVGTLPANAFDAILPSEEYHPSYDLTLTDDQWEQLWSDDDEPVNDYEDWYEEKWNSDEFWGSFTSDIACSYDRKYYAAQTWEPTTRDKTGMVTVTIYEARTGLPLTSFVPARSQDFWGVCWERDSYTLWVQSADTGIFAYGYEDGTWTRNGDLKRPDYIISRWDEEYRQHPEKWSEIYRNEVIE